MSRYSGLLGVREDAYETEPGIYAQGVTHIPVVGNIMLQQTSWQGGELQQDSPSAGHRLSLIIPDNAISDFSRVVYATWQGLKWHIRSIQYIHPRLEVTLGGRYNEQLHG